MSGYRRATTSLPDSTGVLVCSACLTACCWQGILHCENARNASVVTKTVGELKKLKREHHSYWEGRQI